MTDARETAIAIMEGESKLFADAEEKLAMAVARADEAEKKFWQSVFDQLSLFLKSHAEQDDVSWSMYKTARDYADGAVPKLDHESGGQSLDNY